MRDPRLLHGEWHPESTSCWRNALEMICAVSERSQRRDSEEKDMALPTEHMRGLRG